MLKWDWGPGIYWPNRVREDHKQRPVTGDRSWESGDTNDLKEEQNYAG